MKTLKKACGIALALIFTLTANLKAQYLFTGNTASGFGFIGEYGQDGSTNNASLLPAYTSGLIFPSSMAFSGNDLFVTDYVPPGNAIVREYSISGATVNASLISAGLNYPGGLVISGTNLFFANGTNIGQYTVLGQTVNASLITGLSVPEGIAISGNHLFVANAGSGTIGEYGLDGSTVNASLITGLSVPEGIAISGTNLFVANWGRGTIGEYTTSGTTVNASLISGLAGPYGIAIWGNDLFVCNGSSGHGYLGEYTTSGEIVNASLISGLNYQISIAIGSVPQLNIAAVSNQVILYYPAWATNYVLQSVTNLTSTNWLTVTDGVPFIGATNTTLPVTNGLPARFFRLTPAQ